MNFETMIPDEVAHHCVSQFSGGKRMASGDGFQKIIAFLSASFAAIKSVAAYVNVPWDKVPAFMKDLTADLFSGNITKAKQDVSAFIALIIAGLFIPSPAPAVDPNKPAMP